MSSDQRRVFELGYRPALDGLRAVFVLMVMGYHLDFVDFHAGHLRGGFLGVDGFFVLSGFLITTLLCREWERNGRISLGRFYARRALRLLPALCIVLLCALLYAFTLATREDTADIRQSIFPILFYYANWAAALAVRSFRLFGHAWSLSLEEQFYLLWPPALLIMLRRLGHRSRILWLVLVAIAGSASWRIVLWLGGASPARTGFALDTRADTVLVGCLIGLLASWQMLPSSRRARRYIKVLAIASTVLLLALTRYATAGIGDYLTGGVTVLVAVAFGSIIVMLLSAPIRAYVAILELPLLVQVGRISYGLYLWHWPLYLILSPDRFHLPRVALAMLQVGATCTAAMLSYWLIERRFLRLRSIFRADGAVTRQTRSARAYRPGVRTLR